MSQDKRRELSAVESALVARTVCLSQSNDTLREALRTLLASHVEMRLLTESAAGRFIRAETQAKAALYDLEEGG